MSGEQHTYRVSAIDWLCFHHCPFNDEETGDCHPSSLRCPVLRFKKVRWAEREARRRGVSLLDVPSARELAESAGLGEV